MLAKRARLLRTLRAFLDDRGYLEVSAPTVVTSPGMEPHLDAFELSGDGARRFLHTSPEYALKRLLGDGHTRLYSLGPCYRDEPASRTHSPEFTMLEWYAVGMDLPGMMAETEALFAAAADALGYAVPRPFERLAVREAFARYADAEAFDAPLGDFFQVFLDRVEPALGRGRPTFLYGYPASQAALARIDPEDPSVALRFELFAGGHELANAFDELTDPVEQRARFEAEQAERRAAGRAVHPVDEALLDALGRMQQTCGVALGVDRLLMVLTGADDIADVTAQPW